MPLASSSVPGGGGEAAKVSKHPGFPAEDSFQSKGQAGQAAFGTRSSLYPEISCALDCSVPVNAKQVVVLRCGVGGWWGSVGGRVEAHAPCQPLRVSQRSVMGRKSLFCVPYL